MTTDFDAFLANVLAPQNDGQSLHDTMGDAGGATAYGATLPALTAFLGRPATLDDLRALKPGTQEIADFYRGFWADVRGDDLPTGISLQVADFGVTDGPGTSIKMLQRAVGVEQDGAFGNLTRAAVWAMDPLLLILSLVVCQCAYDSTLRSYPRFSGGWLSRIGRNGVLAIKMQTQGATT